MQFAERDFMENIEKIIEIQKKLISLIKKYEKKTHKLIDCDIDEISMLVKSRENILKRIWELSGEVTYLCGENTQMKAAFENTCGRSELPEEIYEIFDLRQEFNIYAARAHSMEPGIIEKIHMLKDNLLTQIKENNAGPAAKAAKYYNAGLTQGKNLYFPENKKKI